MQLAQPKDAIEDIVQIQRMQANTKDIRIMSQLQNIRSLKNVRFDVQRLQQVLMNVLSNSIVYSPPGSEVRVFADLHMVNMTDGDISVTVEDQGIGIKSKYWESVFDQSFRKQMRRASDMNPTGKGMSLRICKKIC